MTGDVSGGAGESVVRVKSGRGRLWPCLVLLLCLVAGQGAVEAATPHGPPRALILYDASPPYGWKGELHAVQLANLLGHFPIPWTMQPIESYASGQLEEYSVTFYIGSEYDNPLPVPFVSEAMATEREVCWFGYNLWQLAWDEYGSWDSQFTARYGFQFAGVDGTGFPQIWYKGQSLVKDQSDPDIGVTAIIAPEYAEVLATAYRPPTAWEAEAECPYVVHAGNLWYFADLPFSYISEEDRYLAFCDLLHDIVGIDHPTSRRALIRIEDVHPLRDPAQLEAIADYLYGRGVPFQVAVIPVFADPLGVWSGGIPLEIRLSESPAVVSALHYMVARGGEIILHGYTHQYDAVPNPDNGMTGYDYEFYRVVWQEATSSVELLGPVPEDSVAWVNDRIDRALAELSACGLSSVAWEVPHYLASPLDYVEFGRRFSVNSGRIAYTSTLAPYIDGQFYPYPTKSDIYGQRISPENLGYVDPTWLPEDIIRAAEKNLVIRDAWASAFFHPFLDLSLLQDVVEGIEALGYVYCDLPTLTAEAGPDMEMMAGESVRLEGSASGGSAPYSYAWSPATGLDDPYAARPFATPDVTTVYQLTVSDASGQTDGDIMTVIVAWSEPVADFAADPASGTVPLTVSFSDLSSGYPTSWEWDFGDGGTSTEQNPSHTYTALGSYTVTLTAANIFASHTETKAHYIWATFPDVAVDHWACDYILACVSEGIVAGYPDGLYRPDLPVTRDQMAVYIARALEAPTGEAALADWVPADPQNFPDVPADHWAYTHIEYCVENAVVEGYEDGLYHPEYEVTRDQMAVYVARAMVAPTGEAALADYVPSDPRSFPDVASDFWAYTHVEYCVENGVVQGYEDGYYHPDYVVTRDQMAVYVARAFGLLM